MNGRIDRMNKLQDIHNKMVQKVEWYNACIAGERCYNVEDCITKLGKGMTKPKHNQYMAYRLFKLGFPTIYETSLFDIEKRGYTKAAVTFIRSTWEALWFNGAAHVISDIEDYQSKIMEHLQYAGYSLLRAKSEDIQTFLHEIDHLDSTLSTHKEYFSKNSLTITPLKVRGYLSPRDNLYEDTWTNVDDIVQIMPSSPAPYNTFVE